MAQWHEKRVARIGIRVAGLALLGAAWMEGLWLQALMAAKPSADASSAQILLAALMFASVSLGLMFAVIGAGLWKPVQVSDRWTTLRNPVFCKRASSGSSKATHRSPLCQSGNKKGDAGAPPLSGAY